ncbi:hypothetical protein [Microbulbifer sp.]|uniref:hypothetical protein n=1 Tax=Microbulbifer sp. TaxID=1908541 RepID=UPI003F344E4F
MNIHINYCKGQLEMKDIYSYRIYIVTVVLPLLVIGTYIFIQPESDTKHHSPPIDKAETNTINPTINAEEKLADKIRRSPVKNEHHVSSDNTFSSLSIFNVPAIDAYNKFINSAEDGDRVSQYYISKIIERCGIVPVSSEEDIRKLEKSGQISNDMLIDIKRLFNPCKELLLELKGKNLWELTQEWLATSSSNGLQLATLTLALENPDSTNQAEVESLIISSLNESNNDPILRHGILESIHSYYTSFIEPSKIGDFPINSGYKGPVDGYALGYLACIENVHCSIDVMEKDLADHFYQYEVDMIVDRSEEILTAIKNKNWALLGFETTSENFK